jgi:hypothetical protein
MMKVYLSIIIALTAISQFAQADEFCNWGFAGPKVFRCDGKNYVYGTAACPSGIYRAAFCQEKNMDDGKACSNDNEPATIDCYNKMVAPRKPSPAPKTDEWCNWGFEGPKVITCDGQRYVYGTAACPSGLYRGIFCREELSQSGKDCSDDNSPATIQCYDKVVQVRRPMAFDHNDSSSDNSKPAGGAK